MKVVAAQYRCRCRGGGTRGDASGLDEIDGDGSWAGDVWDWNGRPPTRGTGPIWTPRSRTVDPRRRNQANGELLATRGVPTLADGLGGCGTRRHLGTLAFRDNAMPQLLNA